MPGPTLDLPRVEHAEVTLDGAPTEAVWGQALILPPMTAYLPSDSSPVLGTDQTRVFADDRALWVSVVVTDPEPDRIRAGLGRRDSRWYDDFFTVAVDVRGEGRSALVFVVNPLGVQYDVVHVIDADEQPSWDATWKSAAHRTATGWEAEMQIPWSALGLGGDVPSISLAVFRSVSRTGQLYAWPSTPTGTDTLQTEARLMGPGRLPPRSGIWVMPELTWQGSLPSETSVRPSLYGFSAGATAGWEPGGPVSAHVTLNPDFSQLESDTTQLDTNVRHPLQYEEKRSFFLEELDQFVHPMADALYTRTIAAPLYGARASVDAGPFGAVALHALDLAPPASVSEGDGWTRAELGDAPALATYVRARYGLGADSYVGLVASDRTVLGTDLYNRWAGLDARWRVADHAYIDAAASGAETVLGPGLAPTRAPAGVVEAVYRDDVWSGRLRLDYLAPGFRDENGYLPYDDRMGAKGGVGRAFDAPIVGVTRLSINPLDARGYVSTALAPREALWAPNVTAAFDNSVVVSLAGQVGGEEFAGAWIPYQAGVLFADLPLGEAFQGQIGGTLGTGPYYDRADPRPGLLQDGWASVTIQPVPRLALTLEPAVQHMSELDGDELFLVWNARAKALLFVTREGWIRLVAERTVDGDDRWRIEPVLAWEWSPGRAIYLGGAMEDHDAGHQRVWQAFAKVSWRFLP